MPGSVRLRPTPPPGSSLPAPSGQQMPPESEETSAAPAPYVQGEFERYVQRLTSMPERKDIRRLGWELVTTPEMRPADFSPLAPDDYLIGPGDELLVAMWGSVDTDLRLTVDRSGRITIPRVGAVSVAGARLDELKELLTRRVGQVFRNFELTVSLGQLRAIRVLVTGHVQRPGAYTVSSLSTVVSALIRAGGPSAAGTFRQIEVRRGAALLGQFDLYELLFRGDRVADRILQAGDVVHVGPVGAQVGVIGSVNKPAVVELRHGETAAEALRLAGGFAAIANRARVLVERLEDRNTGRVVEMPWPASQNMSLGAGDVIRVLSAVDAVLPTLQQSKRVRVEGEVLRPGEYVLEARSSVADAIRAAGGLTTTAYVYATQFERESVRVSQQENYDRALRDLETEMTRSSSSRRLATQEEAAGRQAADTAQARLIERLRALRPTGRVVLQLSPEDRELPNLALEDGDRIYVPSKPTTVGVFGSVFNAATYLHTPGRSLGDYLRLAGGPAKGADETSMFVVRANGQVISARQDGSRWFRRGDDVLTSVRSEPGDTLFVPEELDKTTFLQFAKDWTQVLYQFGLGIAGLRTLR